MKKTLFLCVLSLFVWNNAGAADQEHKEQHSKESTKATKHEKQVQETYAKFHAVLQELKKVAVGHGDAAHASKLVLFDIQAAMEHPDYNLHSPRTYNALKPFVSGWKLSSTAFQALVEFGKEDLDEINKLMHKS